MASTWTIAKVAWDLKTLALAFQKLFNRFSASHFGFDAKLRKLVGASIDAKNTNSHLTL